MCKKEGEQQGLQMHIGQPCLAGVKYCSSCFTLRYPRACLQRRGKKFLHTYPRFPPFCNFAAMQRLLPPSLEKIYFFRLFFLLGKQRSPLRPFSLSGWLHYPRVVQICVCAHDGRGGLLFFGGGEGAALIFHRATGNFPTKMEHR